MQEQEGFIDGANEQQGQKRPTEEPSTRTEEDITTHRTQYETPDSSADNDSTQVVNQVDDNDGA